jgi:ComF family protein
VYEGDVRELLLAMKFGGRERIASVLGAIAAERWCRPGELEGHSAVVPVPLSRKRQRTRGFNQAERIATAIARVAGLAVRRGLLMRQKDRPPQSGLSAAARRHNVAGSYRARIPSTLHGHALLLVDDVLTTGATADAAAKALRRAGAGAVDVLTLARVR